jgi:hypothetical protein
VSACTHCNGSGLLNGHGHVPGKSDYEGREHECYDAGCPFSLVRDVRGQGVELEPPHPPQVVDAPF